MRSMVAAIGTRAEILLHPCHEGAGVAPAALGGGAAPAGTRSHGQPPAGTVRASCAAMYSSAMTMSGSSHLPGLTSTIRSPCRVSGVPSASTLTRAQAWFLLAVSLTSSMPVTLVHAMLRPQDGEERRQPPRHGQPAVSLAARVAQHLHDRITEPLLSRPVLSAEPVLEAELVDELDRHVLAEAVVTARHQSPPPMAASCPRIRSARSPA